ncbi:MAG: hypothetical protein QOI95_4399 [Acidimicrobiaceae bacterium]|jgi:hypothetical protein
MDEQTRLRARRLPVGPEDTILDGERCDYADSFEIQLRESDSRSPEQFARCALEEAPQPLRWIIRAAHKHILRLDLGPDASPDHVFGWKILTSRADLLHLEAVSPLLGRAAILGQRVSPARSRITTYLFFAHTTPARALWTLAGPLHRTVAPILLEHAAASASRFEHVEAARN